MPSKQRIAAAILILAMGLVILIQGLIIFLPDIAGYLVRTRLSDLPPGFTPAFSVESVGLRKTRLQDLRLGEDIRADFLEIFYTWHGESSLQVTDARISGLEIGAALDSGNTLRINGIPLDSPTAQNDRAAGLKSPGLSQAQIKIRIKAMAPFIPARVSVTHSRLRLKVRGSTLDLPFDARGVLTPEAGKAMAAAEVSVMGQSLRITAEADLEGGARQLTLEGRNLSPQCLAGPLLPEDLPVTLTGPAEIRAVMAESGRWQVELGGVTVSGEKIPRLHLDQCTGNFDPETRTTFLSGTIDLVSLSEPSIPFDFSGSLDSQRRFDLKINSRPLDRISLDRNNRFNILPASLSALSFARPRLSIHISGNEEIQKGELLLSGGAAEAMGPGDTKISAKGLEALARTQGSFLSADPKDTGKPRDIFLSARLDSVELVQGSRRGYIPKCGGEGRIGLLQEKAPQADFTVWAEGASLSLPGESLSAHGLSFKTRISRPFIPASRGRLDIRELVFEDRLRAKFSSRLSQVDDQTFRLAGSLSGPDLINKNIEVDIEAGFRPDVWAEAHAAGRHVGVSQESLKTLVPGVKFTGEVDLDTSVDVRAAYRQGEFSSGAALEIHDGSVTLPASGIEARGIRGVLGIRDLTTMESYPGQELSIDTVTMGQFRFDKADLKFRINDPHSVGIENLRFNWCNGLVSSEAVQLQSKEGPVRFILFCDRLEMDMLLNQMGAFESSGGGTLSGRIPVTYEKGNLSFENGFLFSTPGKGGRIFVKDLDRLVAGFPKGTPESTYLEMAGEALKDFQYNWATLKMNTDGDTLNVNMELDGKPARILPFEFRKDINAFVRVDAKSPGARFQGIKLDLNLKLPFNQMAKFGSKLKGLME